MYIRNLFNSVRSPPVKSRNNKAGHSDPEISHTATIDVLGKQGGLESLETANCMSLPSILLLQDD